MTKSFRIIISITIYFVFISPVFFLFFTADVLHLSVTDCTDALYLYMFVIWPSALAFLLYSLL